MSTMKEKFLRRMRNDNPDWLGDPWDCFADSGGPFKPLFMDPVFGLTQMKFDEFYQDMFGVTYFWKTGDPGTTPYITPENVVVKDLARWRDYIKLPDITNLDWSGVEAQVKAVDRNEFLVMAINAPGVFEFSHLVLGFEEALIAYIEEPDLLNEMLTAYADWKLEWAKQVCDHIAPDVIHSHDDWGTKQALFISPEAWRKCVKPHFARIYGYYKSRGVLVQHHSDCVNHEVAEDMVDLGIDMWQGCIPQNDIKGVVERTNGKLCILGGIDMQITDIPNWNEEVIRKEVRRAIDEYAPLGCFIPCIANIVAIHPPVGAIIHDEMNKYGAQWMAEHAK